MASELSRRALLRMTTLATGGAVAGGLAVPAAGAEAASTPGAAAGTPLNTPGAAAPPYPPVGPGTAFLDHASLLGDLPEPRWFESNIPFVDLPDAEIQQVYYYRWRVHYEALKYTGAKDGWIVSEFLGPVGYSAPSGAIVAAAGHHVHEGRWLRDRRYLDDYLRYWLRGSGTAYKEPSEELNPHVTDWAHQYSFWAAHAAYQRASVTGDWDFPLDLLPELVRQWERWSPMYDGELGLYWQTPVWDAMEYTASSYQSDDPYHGGEGFRPTINSYQYGDARAIAALARRAGDQRLAADFDARADRLREAHDRWLWDESTGFYKHMMRDGNPDHVLIEDREEIGFVPWMFGLAPEDKAAAWQQLTDPDGFAAEFGPTTVERRSRWFMHEAYDGCCRWDGPSWPYATSQTLTALAALLVDYPTQSYVDNEDYCRLLAGYARTQHKDGMPYVAEAHDPDQPVWMYDSEGHSEDYNHSTFNDLVLSGLLGVRAQDDDSVLLHPLVPGDWSYFGLENLAYHGHNLTVLWDRDGSRYGRGAGLSVHIDGRESHRQDDLRPVRVAMPAATRPALPREVDMAVNLAPEAGFPTATASFHAEGHEPAKAIDGQKHFLDVPSTRWSNAGSAHGEDWLAVDFGGPVTASDVRVFFHGDGVPAEFRLQHRDSTGAWVDVPEQRRNPATPTPNELNRITFPALDTRELRLLLTPRPGKAVEVATFQCWRRA